jgi:hypothetical protein
LALTTLFCAQGRAQCAGVEVTDPPASNFEYFGTSVAVDGDTAVIGVPGRYDGGPNAYGVALVYERIGGNWTKVAKLTTSTPQVPPPIFGGAVAIANDVIVVGAEGMDTGSGPSQKIDAGQAYVFVKPSGGWVDMTQSATLTPTDLATGDVFGASVAASGDWVIVGAPYKNNQQGAAYVFKKPTGGWSGTINQNIKLFVTGVAQDLFGYSVALRGDYAVVGTPGRDTAGTNSNAGAAYMHHYTGGGSGFWQYLGELPPLSHVTGEFLGTSVAVDYPFAMVGAPGPSGGTGRVVTFAYVGGSWLEQSVLTADDGATDDAFGWDVQLSGDRAVIAAHLDDDQGTDTGSVYVFEKASLWSQTLKLTAMNGGAIDDYGRRCALSGSHLLVGARWDDSLASDAGSVHAYELDGVVGTPFCFCPAGSDPCSNPDPNAGCGNKPGKNGAHLTGCGSASAFADDLVLNVTTMPSGTSAIAFMSMGIPTQGTFGNGLLCLTNPVHRFGQHSAGADGTWTYGPGIVSLSQSWGADAIDSGDTARFQVWYRNLALPCGEETNLSNALEVTFLP